MIVLPRSLALTQPGAARADNPVIGWRSVVTQSNVTASSEDPSHPASNLALPATFDKWAAETAAGHTLTIAPDDSGEIDYVAVARHNWGSARIPVIVSGRRTPAEAFSTLVETVPVNNRPMLLRFEGQSFHEIEIALPRGLAAPQAAALNAGRLLVFQDGIEAGFTPPPYARRMNASNGFSRSGEFLGRVVTGESVRASMRFTELDSGWYRSELEPFLKAALGSADGSEPEPAPAAGAPRPALPFFAAWHPQLYPAEVFYGVLANTPRPAETGRARVGLTLELAGAA